MDVSVGTAEFRDHTDRPQVSHLIPPGTASRRISIAPFVAGARHTRGRGSSLVSADEQIRYREEIRSSWQLVCERAARSSVPDAKPIGRGDVLPAVNGGGSKIPLAVRRARRRRGFPQAGACWVWRITAYHLSARRESRRLSRERIRRLVNKPRSSRGRNVFHDERANPDTVPLGWAGSPPRSASRRTGNPL